MRAMLPALFQPSAMAGRTMAARPPSSAVSGNHFSTKPKKYCKSSEVIKTGIDTPSSETPMNSRSSRRSLRMAAATPAASPSAQANSAASSASCSV